MGYHKKAFFFFNGSAIKGGGVKAVSLRKKITLKKNIPTANKLEGGPGPGGGG